jgi:hypothetical protein
MLRLVAVATKPTGVREEFVCATCGQTMVRFLAKQTSPPPSDVWRNEQAPDAQAAHPTGDPAATPLEDPGPEPAFEGATFEECAAAAALEYESFEGYVPPPEERTPAP